MDIPKSILMQASTSHHETSNDPSSPQMMDKLIEKLISMAMPIPSISNVSSSNASFDSNILARIDIQKTRPQLSIPIMSRNSILLLQRLSVPFGLIDDCIRLINWVDPLWNITLGLIITLMILKPINLITFPLGYICFQIILPCYTGKTNGDWNDPKPVSEFSREFLLNVTDLQNHMLLYVDTWDYTIKLAKNLVFFKDERLTWVLFVSLLIIITVMETFGTSIVWIFTPFFKLLAVAALWMMLISLHPQLRLKFLNRIHDEELRLRTLSLLNKLDDLLIKDVDLKLNGSIKTKRELKKFIVFELQIWNSISETWQFTCFSNDAYPLNSHIRKNKVSFKGTETLTSVIPPEGFQWVINGVKDDDHDSSLIMIDSEMGKLTKDRRRRQRLDSKRKLKPFILDNSSSYGIFRDGWSLDMEPSIWVNEDLMDPVVSIDNETKWVYDDSKEALRIRRRRWVRFAISENCGDSDEEEDEEEYGKDEGEEPDVVDSGEELNHELNSD